MVALRGPWRSFPYDILPLWLPVAHGRFRSDVGRSRVAAEPVHDDPAAPSRPPVRIPPYRADHHVLSITARLTLWYLLIFGVIVWAVCYAITLRKASRRW